MEAIKILFNEEVLNEITSLKEDINQSPQLKKQIKEEIFAGKILEYIKIFDDDEQVLIIKKVVQNKNRRDIAEICLLLLYVDDIIRDSIVPFLSKGDIDRIIKEANRLKEIELSENHLNDNASDEKNKKFRKLRIKLLFGGFMKKIKRYK